ncbi:uncharacterized protein N7529_006963 [Penicillium soppii]|uniref:uncharacterized protein n=1 Tax=Penicillium soppii TaxID=69789 RepID=UPI0025477AA2|nr:uncharacterized protein N7529_006963 [Penicillium soppii]KAJ5865047.1 hypothetical protein N7529_006963 [Penicillium soppii]
MANQMDVDSPQHPPKPLSGHFPGLPPTKTGATLAPTPPAPPATNINTGRDPRRAGTTGPSVDTQSSALLPKPEPKATGPVAPLTSSPQLPSPVIISTVSGPSPIEVQNSPVCSDSFSISDLVNSLIKGHKEQDEKVRLQKEVASLTKSLQRAKQFPHFAGATRSYQSQLERVKNDLANHTKAMGKNKAHSDQAQNDFNTVLSRLKPNPELDQLPVVVKRLESELSDLRKAHDSPAANNPSETFRSALKDIETFRLTAKSSDEELQGLRRKLQGIEVSLQGCLKGTGVLEQFMAQITRIASSVDYSLKREGLLTSRISKLRTDMNANDKTTQETLSLFDQMVQEIEDNLKAAHEGIDGQILDMQKNLKSSDGELGKRLSELENNFGNLKSNRQELTNQRSTTLAQISTDFDARRRQNAEEIAAMEHRLSLLSARKQSLDNGDLISFRAQNPTTQGGLDPWMARLEENLKKHDLLLEGIQRIHAQAHDAHFKEMDKLTKTQESHRKSCTDRYGETLKKVDGLALKIQDLPSKQEISEMSSTIDTTLKGHLKDVQGKMDELINNLQPVTQTQLKEYRDEVNERLQTVATIHRWLDSHGTAIRSLEDRWNNTTSEPMVAEMTRAMHEMYPHIGKLAQQFLDHRTAMDTNFSNLENANALCREELQNFLADHRKDQEEINKAKADLVEAKTLVQKVQADLKTYETAQKSQPETNDSQQTQLSPEQLKALYDLPTLLQNVKTLEDQFESLNSTTKTHGTELQARLEKMIEMQNQLASQTNSLVELSEKVDGQQEGYDEVAESVKKLDPLNKKIDDYTSQVDNFHGQIAFLNQAAIQRDTVDLNALQSRLDALEGWKNAAVEQDTTETDGFSGLRSRLDALEEWKKTAAEQDSTQTNDSRSFRSQLESLKGLNQAAAQQDILNDSVIKELRSRLKELEELNEAGGQLNASLNKDLDPKTDTAQEPTEREKERDDKVKGFLYRLRKLEDFLKTWGYDPKNFPISDKPTDKRTNSNKGLVSDKAINQRVDNLDTPRPSQNGSSLTLRTAPASNSDPSSNGPTVVHHLPTIITEPTPPIKKEPGRKSKTPSATPLSSQPSFGDVAKPRQVQNLKGKRRRESDVTESARTTPESFSLPSSPAPSSSAASNNGDLSAALSKKERKLARKKVEKEAMNKAARKAAKKRKTN